VGPIRIVLALALSAGLASAAGSAFAGTPTQRINGEFDLADDTAPAGTNTASVEMEGRDFGFDGQVSGTGTSGDQVAILYDAGLPTSASANEKKGKVTQSGFTELTLLLVPGQSGNAALDLTVVPEKCKANASVEPAKDKGKVSVECSGENVFLNISAGQLASFQAAFLDRKDVVINVSQSGSTATLKIRLDQKESSK
jgi:hypothetical protein